MRFEPFASGPRRWLGPYSQSRGKHAGFRVQQGELRAYFESEEGLAAWVARETAGVASLVQMVEERWRGGRVALLPNGLVVKPLQDNAERVVLGRMDTSLVLDGPGGASIDFARPLGLLPGSPWQAPGSIGLEGILLADGSVDCVWRRPTAEGEEETRETIMGPDSALAAAFCASRPGESSGRIRMTVAGHVLTKRELGDGSWSAHYVGQINPASLVGWERWIGEGVV